MLRHKILIVEDHTFIAEAMVEILADAGYDISGIASTVDQAEKLARSVDFCAAVLDYDLNGEPIIPVAWHLHRAGARAIIFSGVGVAVTRRTLPPDFPLINKGSRFDNLLNTLRNTCEADHNCKAAIPPNDESPGPS